MNDTPASESPEVVTSKGIGSSALLGSDFFAKYKNRTPDPGECRILSVNWEERRIEMTNGACRYYPSFDEVEMVAETPRLRGRMQVGVMMDDHAHSPSA
jgi:hypothetical protein